VQHERCDSARTARDMLPLTPDSWVGPDIVPRAA